MAYSVMHADLNEDRDSILALWDRNLTGHGVPDGRYDWIYNNNPCGQPTCFLLKNDQDGHVAGSYTLFPRSLLVNGRMEKAYVCGDLIVDTSHRSLGPALMLIKAALAESEKKSSILFGFPNHLSQPVLLNFGFEVLCDHLEMTKVLKSYPYIQRYVKFEPVARMFALPLDLALKCRPSNWRRNGGNYHSNIETLFDAQFDDFWQKIKGRFSLKGEADSSYMHWRFAESPYDKHYIYTLSSLPEEQLVGYVVFRKVGKRIKIVDIGFSPDDNWLEVLLSSLHQHRDLDDVEAITFDFAGDLRFIERLRKNGFSVRCKELKTIIYTPKAWQGIVEEICHGSWYLTSADNDI